MDQAKIGAFIRTRRIAQGLTQLQLAERLRVTDKAVSKWERGLGYPDIELLLPLADILGISVAELLAGEQNTSGTPLLADAVVVDALVYSDAVQQKKRMNWRLWLFSGLSVSCLLAVLVCFLCASAGQSHTVWFPVTIASLLTGWLVCILPITDTEHPVRTALLFLTLGSLPYLRLLARLLQEPLVWQLSVWIVPLAAAYLWASYAICRKWKERPWLAAGLVMLLAAPVTAAVNAVVGQFVEVSEQVSPVFYPLLAGAVCLIVAYTLHKRQA